MSLIMVAYWKNAFRAEGDFFSCNIQVCPLRQIGHKAECFHYIQLLLIHGVVAASVSTILESQVHQHLSENLHQDCSKTFIC